MILSKPGAPANNDYDIEKYHQGADDNDESQNLLLKGSHSSLRVAGQSGNLTKDRTVPSGNSYTNGSTRNAVSALHADVIRLEIVLVCKVDRSRNGLRFSS